MSRTLPKLVLPIVLALHPLIGYADPLPNRPPEAKTEVLAETPAEKDETPRILDFLTFSRESVIDRQTYLDDILKAETRTGFFWNAPIYRLSLSQEYRLQNGPRLNIEGIYSHDISDISDLTFTGKAGFVFELPRNWRTFLRAESSQDINPAENRYYISLGAERSY